jgi:acyl-homoserine-lactone acylase
VPVWVIKISLSVVLPVIWAALVCFGSYPHKLDNQKRETRGGDGWIIAVEFGKTPRAYSVLAYGQSNKPDSPYFADQLELFANKQMKPVAFTEADIRKQVIREYRPGKEVIK